MIPEETLEVAGVLNGKEFLWCDMLGKKKKSFHPPTNGKDCLDGEQSTAKASHYLNT